MRVIPARKIYCLGWSDGGDGGKGGDVIFRATTNLLTLYDYHHAAPCRGRERASWVRAACSWSGRGGQGYRGAGRDGVYETVEDDGERLLADLTHEGQEVVMAGGAAAKAMPTSSPRPCRFRVSLSP